MIEIKTLVLGEVFTNTYIVKDRSTGAIAVVDPACESEKLVDLVKEWGGDLQYILLTHGHFDHVGGVKCLLNSFSPQVLVSADETELLNTKTLNLSFWHNLSIEPIKVDRELSDKDTFMLGETEFTFIATPGHTVGSGCFIADDIIFSGDTLFCESIGRTDFPTSSGRDMMLSLMKLNDLKGDYTVYPGHDVKTTLSHERKFNPYMR